MCVCFVQCFEPQVCALQFSIIIIECELFLLSCRATCSLWWSTWMAETWCSTYSSPGSLSSPEHSEYTHLALKSFDQKCIHLDLNSFDCNTSVWPQGHTSDLTLLTAGKIVWLLKFLTAGAHILAVNSFSYKWTHLTLNSFEIDEYCCLTQLFWPQYHTSDSIHFDHIDSLHFNHIFTHLTFNCFDSKQDIFGITFITTSEHIFLLTLLTMSTHMTLMSFDHKFTHGVFNALDHEHLNLTLLTASVHIWHCYFCVKCFDIRLKRGIWSTDLDVVQELCESWGGRPGLSILTSLLVSVDIKL